MPQYPLPAGTRIYHNYSGSVFEVLDPPGLFRVISQPEDYGSTVPVGGTFSNGSFWDSSIARQNSGVVTVLDCPVKNQKFERGELPITSPFN